VLPVSDELSVINLQREFVMLCTERPRIKWSKEDKAAVVQDFAVWIHGNGLPGKVIPCYIQTKTSSILPD